MGKEGRDKGWAEREKSEIMEGGQPEVMAKGRAEERKRIEWERK